jgi:multisubunit Na+/H+ antiporter MnhB subunit
MSFRRQPLLEPEIRAFLIHKKENNLKHYNEKKMNSSAQWRSIQKIQDFIDKLNFFKYLAKIIVLIIIVYIFYLFSKFNS